MATQTEPVRTEAAAQPRRDFRQEVTDQIVEMLEKGTAPWQKPWEPGAFQLPFNPTTDKSYRGGNALHLMAVATQRGYEDPRWLTYRQAHENGWQVRKGEKGTHIEYWQFGDKAGRDTSEGTAPEDGKEPSHRGNLLHRVYTVFNAQQIDGVPALEPKRPQEWEVAQTGENILRNSGAAIRHDQADRAFYDRSNDVIHLPAKEAFKSAADYYGTALHEAAHWTGHPSRLNRATLNESYRFGDPNYAKEELRAELASVFLAAERGIPHDAGQHAAYVGSWIAALRGDKNEIFRAAKDAHTAADFMLSLERSPEVRRETSEHVAALDRASSTVNITEKETATEHRSVVNGQGERSPDSTAPARAQSEKILDGEVDGRRPPSEHEAAQSFADAEGAAKRLLGEHARTYQPDTESGKYRGEIIAETGHHVVQRLSAKSAAAHPKHLLPGAVESGQNVLVAYSHNQAQLKPNQARERANGLAR